MLQVLLVHPAIGRRIYGDHAGLVEAQGTQQEYLIPSMRSHGDDGMMPMTMPSIVGRLRPQLALNAEGSPGQVAKPHAPHPRNLLRHAAGQTHAPARP